MIFRVGAKTPIKKIKNNRTYRKTKYIFYRQTIFDPIDHVWSFVGSFTGIGIIGFINSLNFSTSDNLFLIGSFGATAVLLYGATNSPLAQPRNLIGGHLLSSIIGILAIKLIPFPDLLWLTCALAVSLSIVVMQITKTMHPPGGATALIAVIGGEKIQNLGLMYVINPVLSGVFILLVTALIFNNLSKNRSYPYKKSS
ncbi:HPP family protein [Salegentibacter sp. F188]|uniref:HPP family protein n=1 Tax=Autumnicola patrickiae TaxID=3075591 RepID=A0ABU3E0Y4_9FLAO|nr:HPP family protein [Salegentibacter sp. F188]MDT0689575.1 HPP family protein [Salegentibacter sp. F188]